MRPTIIAACIIEAVFASHIIVGTATTILSFAGTNKTSDLVAVIGRGSAAKPRGFIPPEISSWRQPGYHRVAVLTPRRHHAPHNATDGRPNAGHTVALDASKSPGAMNAGSREVTTPRCHDPLKFLKCNSMVMPERPS